MCVCMFHYEPMCMCACESHVRCFPPLSSTLIFETASVAELVPTGSAKLASLRSSSLHHLNTRNTDICSMPKHRRKVFCRTGGMALMEKLKHKDLSSTSRTYMKVKCGYKRLKSRPQRSRDRMTPLSSLAN